jgi:hypothetical protein
VKVNQVQVEYDKLQETLFLFYLTINDRAPAY